MFLCFVALQSCELNLPATHCINTPFQIQLKKNDVQFKKLKLFFNKKLKVFVEYTETQFETQNGGL